MVTQASNRLLAREFIQARWDGVHGHALQCKAIGFHAGGLHFPCLTHVEHKRLTREGLGFYPIVQLCGLNLINHGLDQK